MGLRLVRSGSRKDARPSLATEADVRLAYDAYGGELYRYAVRATGDEGSSQDIVQEIFLRDARLTGSIPSWPACGCGCSRSPATSWSTTTGRWGHGRGCAV